MKKRKNVLFILLVCMIVFAGCNNKEDVKMPETVRVSGSYFNVTSAQLINAVEKDLKELHGSKVNWETDEELGSGKWILHSCDLDESSYLAIYCDPQTDYIMDITGRFSIDSYDFDGAWAYMSILSNVLDPEENTAALKQRLLKEFVDDYAGIKNESDTIHYRYVILDSDSFFRIVAQNNK